MSRIEAPGAEAPRGTHRAVHAPRYAAGRVGGRKGWAPSLGEYACSSHTSKPKGGTRGKRTERPSAAHALRDGRTAPVGRVSHQRDALGKPRTRCASLCAELRTCNSRPAGEQWAGRAACWHGASNGSAVASTGEPGSTAARTGRLGIPAAISLSASLSDSDGYTARDRSTDAARDLPRARADLISRSLRLFTICATTQLPITELSAPSAKPRSTKAGQEGSSRIACLPLGDGGREGPLAAVKPMKELKERLNRLYARVLSIPVSDLARESLGNAALGSDSLPSR